MQTHYQPIPEERPTVSLEAVPTDSVSGQGSLTERSVETWEDQLWAIMDMIPVLAWSARLDGSAEFFNRRWLDYAGLCMEEARDWGWMAAVHPDNLSKLTDYWRSILASGEPGEIEARLRRYDGEYRWFLVRATPSFDCEGRLVRWFGTNTDIQDRKGAECLLAGENLVLEMTAKGHSLESILEALCRVVEQTASGCLSSVLLFDPSGSKIQQAIAPSLPSSYNDQFPEIMVDREYGPCTQAARDKTQVIVSDVASDPRWGTYGWRISALTHGLKACWSTIILASNGLVLGAFAIYWREPRRPTEQDQKVIEQITHLAAVVIERKRNEAALRESEERFRLIVDTIPGFVFTLSTAGKVELLNRQALEYFGQTLEEWKNSPNFSRVHPDDLPRVMDAYRRWLETRQPQDLELRQRRADGLYRWFQSRALPARDVEGRVTGWYILLTDIDDRKRAEGELAKAFEVVAKSEAELRRIVDAIPQLITVVGADGEFLYANQANEEYTGLTKEDVGLDRFRALRHPDDIGRLHERDAAISRGMPFEYELRLRRRDGQYHWFLVQYNPLLDERGNVIHWYATCTDIDERKKAEERTWQENIALREQIDQAFMFEEIVGSCPALKAVRSSVMKVAPTNSTVLITGETGTGKELIARAIHKNSQRAGQAFITVNCASLPSSLIASELFGHEKGAFTGATQRRLGRFELANGGTIFLDEISELPAETQVALLRVLQEREFERVGGTRSIVVDVRVVAATNRDLKAEIANGTFRADLFYRLNVFPIQMPSLRERKDDILTLLEYFVQRFSRKLGKNFSKIDKRTFELCRSYDWPGNVRELQNVVERSVIISSEDVFSVDEAWLSLDPAKNLLGASASEPANFDLERERQIIEEALEESAGRVYGASGAAASLGIPPSTLDSKIKKLKIRKSHFKLN
ncbi:MAG: formate hydrogenlyase transcriptional activator [Acidobacteriaceae bacterium]|jgi:PAS domain S-box-containing protein|nr:formate hydrogenlyase transcriptional activator [Acidobacteriaceae bacterium]